MNRQTPALVTAFALSAFVATGCATMAPPAQSTSAESAVRAAMASFMDALNSLDVPRMSGFFADDVTAFVPVAQADEAVGRAAVTRIFQVFADRTRATTSRLALVPESERVEASASLGIVTFQVHETSPAVTRRRTFVWRLVDGRWLISHFHASDIRAASP